MSNKCKKSLGITYLILLALSAGLGGSYLVLYPLKDFLMTAEISDLQAFEDIFNITCGVFIWIFDIKMFQEVFDNIQ